MHDVWLIGDGEDIETSLLEEIGSNEMTRTRVAKPRTSKPIIGVQAITITCVCGGLCEQEGGSTMISIGDNKVACPSCGVVYTVPAGVFEKRLNSN